MQRIQIKKKMKSIVSHSEIITVNLLMDIIQLFRYRFERAGEREIIIVNSKMLINIRFTIHIRILLGRAHIVRYIFSSEMLNYEKMCLSLKENHFLVLKKYDNPFFHMVSH